MRRFALAVAALGLLVGVVFIAFFSASRFRQDDQTYWESLSDFAFMNRYYGRRFIGLDPPALTKTRYESVMSHAKKSAHYEVDEVVARMLERWGGEVEPYLLEELDAWRSVGRVRVAAIVLARLDNPAAIGALQQAGVMGDRWLEIEILDELHALGPSAAPAMIGVYHDALQRGLPIPYNLLEAIGRSGGGADFLLDQLAQASSDEEIQEVQWPLAFTRDPRAARALYALMHHPNIDVRRRSRDSMSQSMGAAAVEPALDFLEQETDDYLRSWVIQSHLATHHGAGSARAVEYLAPLVEHPVLSWEANYALARIGSEKALEVLRERARRRSARWAMSNLEYSGSSGIRLLED